MLGPRKLSDDRGCHLYVNQSDREATCDGCSGTIPPEECFIELEDLEGNHFLCLRCIGFMAEALGAC